MSFDTSENQNTTSGNELHIVSAQENDSTGSKNWKEYLNRSKLRNAWQTPQGSPYATFQKFRTIDSIGQLASKIAPRYSEGEANSENGIDDLVLNGTLNKETAIILDSGGAHSVAMAVRLAERGYQPIIMFDSIPDPNGVVASEQELATLLYFAEEIEQMKLNGSFKPNSPPVFVLNCHRNDTFSYEPGRVLNNHTYSKTDFPSPELLKKQGINKVLYINEADLNSELIQSKIEIHATDLQPTVANWMEHAIKMLRSGILPWKDKSSRHKLDVDTPMDKKTKDYFKKIILTSYNLEKD